MALFIFIWLVCAGFAAYIATQKNRGAGNWFLLGIVFGIFALFAVMAVPKLGASAKLPESDDWKTNNF
jgi:hypothetical protein